MYEISCFRKFVSRRFISGTLNRQLPVETRSFDLTNQFFGVNSLPGDLPNACPDVHIWNRSLVKMKKFLGLVMVAVMFSFSQDAYARNCCKVEKVRCCLVKKCVCEVKCECVKKVKVRCSKAARCCVATTGSPVLAPVPAN